MIASSSWLIWTPLKEELTWTPQMSSPEVLRGSVFEDVRKFVTSCHTCLGNEPSSRAPAGLARPLPPPTLPWV